MPIAMTVETYDERLARIARESVHATIEGIPADGSRVAFDECMNECCLDRETFTTILQEMVEAGKVAVYCGPWVFWIVRLA